MSGGFHGISVTVVMDLPGGKDVKYRFKEIDAKSEYEDIVKKVLEELDCVKNELLKD